MIPTLSTAIVLSIAVRLGNAVRPGYSINTGNSVRPGNKVRLGNAQTDWWHQDRFGGEDFVSNPYYNTFQQMKRQMEVYAPATHVGKIYRGRYSDPDLYTPRDRTLGFQSDFNPGDYLSGAFKFAPKQQKVRATDGMIRAGFAEKLGEIISLPNNVEVNDDGSVLVQTSVEAKHPCNPNPCERYALNKVCSIVNKRTAKCSSVSSVTVSVEWGVTDDDAELWLYMHPAWRNGTACETMLDYNEDDYYYLYYDMEACGAMISENAIFDYDSGNRVKEYSLLSTTQDGFNFRDFTYAVGVEASKIGDNNIDLERTVFKVKIGDKLVQTILAPEDEDGEDGSTMDLDNSYDFYFLGCFRPNLGFIDTRGAGYFDDEEEEIFDGSDFEDPDLCYKLLSHPGPSGFNVNTFEIE